MIQLNRTTKIVVTFAIVLGGIVSGDFLLAPRVSAAYEAGRLIDDSLFLDAGSMNKTDIQNFLVSKNSGLKDRQFTLSCYGADSQERRWYTAAGAQCDTLMPASAIIYYASQIYGVNPKVILGTLQKEQGLVTATNPTATQVNQARWQRLLRLRVNILLPEASHTTQCQIRKIATCTKNTAKRPKSSKRKASTS